MCRIFAFTSRVSLRVQRSLVKADNALQLQSRRHPHGWGIAYYLAGAAEPTQVKSVASAFDDDRFARVSEFLTSHAVIALVRKATVGDLRLENTHPFHWNGWTFCHNGTLFGFDEVREELRSRLPPRLRSEILGTTDSETLFYLVLAALESVGVDLDSPPDAIPQAAWDAIGELAGWVRDVTGSTGADERESMMNWVLTNGTIWLASRFNGGLSFSTQKTRCADFDVCPIRDKVCFGPRREGIRHTHVLIASDPTSPDDVWEEMPNRSMLAVDSDLRLRIAPLPGVQGAEAWFA
jgi:glutamine amidotransferase